MFHKLQQGNLVLFLPVVQDGRKHHRFRGPGPKLYPIPSSFPPKRHLPMRCSHQCRDEAARSSKNKTTKGGIMSYRKRNPFEAWFGDILTHLKREDPTSLEAIKKDFSFIDACWENHRTPGETARLLQVRNTHDNAIP